MTNYDDVSALTKAPILSESEERRLVRLAQRGDLTAQDRLVESNMRLVIELSRPYINSGIPFADLIQEGALGLMRAIPKFQPNRGHRFMTYAGQWVRQALSRAVDNKSKFIRLPSFVHEYVRKINKARAEFLQDCGVQPDTDELAERLGSNTWPCLCSCYFVQLRLLLVLSGPRNPVTALMDDAEKFREMRHTAREIFLNALREASIDKGFARHVHCERGVLRVCDDLYDLQAYSRVLVISIGKAGHTMVEALASQVGEFFSRASWQVQLSRRRRFAAFDIFVAGILPRMPNRFMRPTRFLDCWMLRTRHRW